MSQFNLTPEEDAIVADALRAKAAAYTAMFGSVDAALEALIAKVEGQLPAPVVAAPVAASEPVVEAAPVVEETVEEMPVPTKAKKSKASAE